MSRLRPAAAGLLAAVLATAVGAQEKATFGFKVEKDKPFYQEMTTNVVQSIKVQGQDLKQTQEQTFFFKWTPVKQDGDNWQIKQQVEGVKMKIDISGNAIEYDSTNKNAAGSGGNPGLTDFFKGLEGAEFTVTYNTKDNKVSKVDGKDDFLKKLASGNAQMESLLKKILTDEALKQMTDPTFGLAVAGEKAKDQPWESKTALNLGPIGTYDVTYKYTYKGKDEKNKELDKVEVVPTLTYKPPTDNADGLLFRIKNGNLKSEAGAPGVILYNAKTGRVESATIPIVLKGDLDVTIGGSDTKVELQQQQTTTVKTGDKSFLPEQKK